MNSKDLSIIIVCKDTRSLLEDLMKSIYDDETIFDRIEEIIVVDNGSKDDTGEFIKCCYPETVYIKNERNLGFASAVNRGLSEAKGSYILLLNSDTRLVKKHMTKMLDHMIENRDIGICGPQLVYPDMTLQRSIAHIPSLLMEVIPPFLLEFLFPRRYPGKCARIASPERRPFDVPSLIGAAIMIKAEALRALNGFDERFFFFLEETDLCVRMRNEGLRVVFFPETEVIHLQGKTVGKNWLAGRIEYNISLYKFIKKHHSYGYYVIFKMVRFLKALLFFFLLTPIPFVLIKGRTKRSYLYHARLLLWHIRHCPDDEGLRKNKT